MHTPNLTPQSSKEYLFHHILLGFVGSFKGILQLYEQGLIEEPQYTQMLEETSKRLVTRIEKFRNAVSLFMAGLFIILQVHSQNGELRRPRSVRGRRIETEITLS